MQYDGLLNHINLTNIPCRAKQRSYWWAWVCVGVVCGFIMGCNLP